MPVNFNLGLHKQVNPVEPNRPHSEKSATPEIGHLHIHKKTYKVKLAAQIVSQSLKTMGYSLLKYFDVLSSSKGPSKMAIRESHENDKLNSIFFHLSVGSSFISPLRNIAKRDIITSNEIAEEADQLLETCHHQLTQRGSTMKIRGDVTAYTAKLDGICMGFSIDVATRYLVNEESIPEILEDNLKGASKEAAANHAVYTVLSAGLILGTEAAYEATLFAPIAQIDQTTFSHQDVLFGLKMLSDWQVLENDSLGEVCTKKVQEGHGIPGPLSDAINTCRHEIEKLTKSEDWNELKLFFQHLGIENNAIVDTNKFKSFLEDKIRASNLKSKELEKSLHSLEILLACIEVHQGHTKLQKKKSKTDPHPSAKKATEKKTLAVTLWKNFKRHAIQLFGKSPSLVYPSDYISNPLLNYQFKSIFASEMGKKESGVICHARGLSQKPVAINHSSNHKSDMEFLGQFKNLPAGFYCLTCGTKPGGHAISYIKDSDDPSSAGYILDPNYGAVKCRDDKHTIKMFQKLLSEYSEPSFKSPLAKKFKRPHHTINLWKLEKHPT